MSNIFIIDDDAAADVLAENMEYRGHSARRVRSVQDALSQIGLISQCDLVILDLLMPEGEDKAGARATGMTVYRKLRDSSPRLPIIVYSATQDGGIVDVINSDENSEFVSRWSGPSLSEFIALIVRKLGIREEPRPLRTFIVHGHDEASKLSLKNYIQNTLHLPEPTILHEQPNQGMTIIEKFEDLACSVDLVFVILTPDDIAASATMQPSQRRRARQNVIFELGYFLGQFGRHSGRIFLLHKGELDLPSDISGLIYIGIDHGIEAAGEQIRREINRLQGETTRA